MMTYVGFPPTVLHKQWMLLPLLLLCWTSICDASETITNPCSILTNRAVELSGDGLGGAIGVFIGIMLLSTFICVRNYYGNKWRFVEYEQVPLIKHLTFKRAPADYFRMMRLGLETTQIVAVILTAGYAFNYWGQGNLEESAGTSFEAHGTAYVSNTNHVIKAILSAFLFNFDEAVYLSKDRSDYNDIYWVMVSLSVALAFAFVILCVLIGGHVDALMGISHKASSTLVFIGGTLGHVLFIPIVLNLLSTFSCLFKYERVVGDGFEEFPLRDCTSVCWEGTHLDHMLLSLFALLLYVPCALYTAPTWTIFHDAVTLKDQPGYVMFTMVWKVWFCGAHAFLEQLPVAHSAAMFVLTGTLFVVTTWWRPTTLPYFDLILIAVCALMFWCSISIICGLFIREWVAIALIVSGCAILVVEWFVLNSGDLGSDSGKYAKDSVQYHLRSLKREEDKRMQRVILRRKLMLLAQHNNRIYLADNPRDIQPLVERDMYIDDILERFKSRNSRANKSIKTAKAVLEARDQQIRAQEERPMKVVGVLVKEDTAVSSQVPLSYRSRDDKRGTLIVIHSPELSLYSYLKMKINGYIAYHNAFLPDNSEIPLESVEYSNVSVRLSQRGKRPSVGGGSVVMMTPDLRYQPYLTVIRGPSHNFAPQDKVIADAFGSSATSTYQPVNKSSLLSIVQNCGSSTDEFRTNIHPQSRDLSSWIRKNDATHHDLGKELCHIFGIDTLVDESTLLGPESAEIQAKVSHHERILNTMEEEYEKRMNTVAQKAYEDGRRARIMNWD